MANLGQTRWEKRPSVSYLPDIEGFGCADTPAQRDRGSGGEPAVGTARLPAADHHPRHWPDHCHDDPGRGVSQWNANGPRDMGERPAPAPPSPPVPEISEIHEVWRHGPCHCPVPRRPSGSNRWRPEGQLCGQSKILTYGNARLRRVLWMAGQTAVLQRANSFRDKFERYIAQDRHNPHLRRKAIAAIAARMARTIHAGVKPGEPCRPFFEATSPGGRTRLCKVPTV